MNHSDEPKTVLVIETKVYSRVVGYYRPIKDWNIGKQTEWENRRLLSVDISMMNIESASCYSKIETDENQKGQINE